MIRVFNIGELEKCNGYYTSNTNEQYSLYR